MALEEFYILLSGCLVAIACAIPGCFLVLRKMSMVSDAISHAVLPGIVLAFLISGSRDNYVMLAGAVAAGVFSSLFIEFLHKKAGLQSDAAIGVTFTWLFAGGVILLTAFASQVDLDQDCVLYGEIALVPFDLISSATGLEFGPRIAYVMGAVILIISLIIGIFFKEFFLTSFDPNYAAAIGINVAFWNQVLMALVSVTTVTAFDAVGAILVVALMVVPASAAYLLTTQFKQMMVLAILFGIAAAIGGYYLALWWNSSIAGSMAVFTGLELVAAFLLRNSFKLSPAKV
jgi:manganese/zinc/iron transport system permease protein